MIDQKYLEGIGVTDAETVKAITEAYTADIAAEKDATAAIQKDLDIANATIQSYKDMDIDGIKASVEDYKQKLVESETARTAFEHKTKVAQYVKGLGLRDDVYEEHVTDLLLDKELKFDGDKLIGGDDVVKAFRDSHADAFVDVKPKPQFVQSTQGTSSSSVDDAFVRQVMGLK